MVHSNVVSVLNIFSRSSVFSQTCVQAFAPVAAEQSLHLIVYTA